MMYGAELEEWTKNSTLFSYAADTSSWSQSKEIGDVIIKLEEAKEETEVHDINWTCGKPCENNT